MDVLTTALNAVLPTFLLIGLGAFTDKWFPDLSMQTLTRLSVYLFIPMLTFNAVASTDLTLSSASLLSVAYILYLLILGGLAFFGSHGLTPETKRGVIITSLFGNTGNMGLPITLFAYGQAGFERAVVLLVVSLTLMFIAGPTLLASDNNHWKQRAKQAFLLPPIWATLAGITVNTTAIALPLFIARSAELLAAAAIPVMLLSLGIQMRRSWVWEVSGSALRSTGLRLLLGPFVALGVAALLGLPVLDRNVLVLSAAMPAAVTMFVVAVEVNGDYRGVARSVVASTVGSVFAILAVLFFLPF